MSKKTKKKEPVVEMDASLIEEALESVDPREEKSPKPGTLDENYDRLLRLTADFDNFRKRVQKEKGELVLHATEELVREILPVLDNFERAIEQGEKTEDAKAIGEGVRMIFMQLKGILERFGVRAISAEGETFDPLLHEAVSYVPSEDHAPNAVMEEHQKGYFMHKLLLRPAIVTVSRGPAEFPSDEAIREETREEK